MEAFNSLLRRAFEAFFGVVGDWPQWVGIAILTLGVMIVAMPIIRWTLVLPWSDRTKRGLAAAIFEMRLYNDRLRTVFRSIFAMLGWAAAYVGVWLLPIAITAVILWLPFAHMQSWWGWQGLEVGETTTLRVHVTGEGTEKPAASATAPTGVTVETPPLWIASRRELVWRLRADAPGRHELEVTVDGESHTKELAVADGPALRSPVRCSSLAMQLLYPAEPRLPKDGRLSHMTLDYEDAPGFLAPGWTWILLLFSFVWYFPLKRPFGVEI